MTMITPSYLGETIEYSSLHACRSTLEDPTARAEIADGSSRGRGRLDSVLDSVVIGRSFHSSFVLPPPEGSMFIGGWAIEGGNAGFVQPQIDGQLPTMMREMSEQGVG